MPPIKKISREDVISTAFEAVREYGLDGLNARTLAVRLGCSTQPIFSNFSGMDELKTEIIKRANELYQSYLKEEMESCKYPVYKASGMGYIRFAFEEKELFKLLYMRDRSGEQITEDREEIRPFINMIMENMGLSEDEAFLFHIEQWIFVHGIATMGATSYLPWDNEFISRAVSDAYKGLRAHFTGRIEE